MSTIRVPEQFGRTHTAWVSTPEEKAEPVAEEKSAPKGKGKRKAKKEPAGENVPF